MSLVSIFWIDSNWKQREANIASNEFMNIRNLKIVIVISFIALPVIASNASAKWNPQGESTGESVMFGDAPELKANIPARAVGLNEHGILEGEVVSIDATSKSRIGMDGLNVFFVQDGKVIKQTKTGPGGSFEIMGIDEGAYSFFAAGRSGFTAHGVYVTGREAASAQSVLTASMASANCYGIQQLLKNNVPAQVASTVMVAAEKAGQGASLEPATQVMLNNGRLTGSVYSVASQTQSVSGIHVHIIQGDQSIAQVQTDDLGKFVVPDILPGVYDVVAAGEQSFAVARFEAIGRSSVMTQVSYRKAAELEITLIQDGNGGDGATTRGNDLVVEPSFEEAGQFAGESTALGGASGGSSGAAGNFSNFSGGGVVRGRFGGGGRGYGRFGGGVGAQRLLLLGGLVGGLSAIDNSDPNDGSPDGS